MFSSIKTGRQTTPGISWYGSRYTPHTGNKGRAGGERDGVCREIAWQSLSAGCRQTCAF